MISVRSFQRRNGLRDDGVVNPEGETFDALTREIDFDDESRSGRRANTTDPDGVTERALRCRQIAVDLENNNLRFENLEPQVEEDRRALEQALERVREAATAKARQPAEIVAAVAGISSALASGNLLLAAAEAGALAVRLVNTETSLNVESRALNQAADALRDVLERRHDLNRETADLQAERDQLGCASIGF